MLAEVWSSVRQLGDPKKTSVFLWAPNYTACVNNLRVSGNVRSVWNGDDGTSECAFLGPNFSVYEFYQYPTAPYAISSAPANLINATLVSCF